MLSPEQLNQIRIERCLHLSQHTAAFNVGERTDAFRNCPSLENLSKLEDALVDYWAVVEAFGATKASYGEILKSQQKAVFNVGERTEAFRNCPSLENLSKLEDALVDYEAVVEAFEATKASYGGILGVYKAMLRSETSWGKAQIFCSLIDIAYPDAHFCEIAIASMRQFI